MVPCSLRSMKRLADAHELLDGPLDDQRSLLGNLRDLGRVNRWLGGTRLSAAGIAALVPDGGPMTLLDVGTGAADIPLGLLDRARRSRRALAIAAIDSRPEVLAAATIAEPRLLTTHGLELHVADGTALPFPDRAFDVAHASLMLHHLEPPQAIALLREMGRVARRGVVINDLARSRLAWLGAWILSRVGTRNRYTRHDAPLSVRRAYTASELTVLLAAAGLRVEASATGLLGHRIVLAARPVPPDRPDRDRATDHPVGAS